MLNYQRVEKLRYRCGLGLSIGIFVGFEWIFLDFNGMLGCYWDVNGMLVGFQTTQMVIYCIGWSPWSKPENETERTMGNPLWNMIYVAFPYLMLTPQKMIPITIKHTKFGEKVLTSSYNKLCRSFFLFFIFPDFFLHNFLIWTSRIWKSRKIWMHRFLYRLLVKKCNKKNVQRVQPWTTSEPLYIKQWFTPLNKVTEWFCGDLAFKVNYFCYLNPWKTMYYSGGPPNQVLQFLGPSKENPNKSQI